jgi:hypothetical protein
VRGEWGGNRRCGGKKSRNVVTIRMDKFLFIRFSGKRFRSGVIISSIGSAVAFVNKCVTTISRRFTSA